MNVFSAHMTFSHASVIERGHVNLLISVESNTESMVEYRANHSAVNAEDATLASCTFLDLYNTASKSYC